MRLRGSRQKSDEVRTSSTSRQVETIDVLMVGVGAAGLTAENDLTACRSLCWKHAIRSAGGSMADRVGEATLELGGQWVSGDRTALRAMLDELELELDAWR